MAIGERIRFIRNLRGMTQKWLGIQAGLPEKSADIRMAQYESGTRVPKEDLTAQLAKALDVSPAALNVPDIESYVGIMHTLFTLEDLYGLKIDEADGDPIIRLNKNAQAYSTMVKMFRAWQEQAQKWRDGKMTKEDYDQWRYKYPELDTTGMFHKIEVSDELDELLTDELMKAREKKRKKKRALPTNKKSITPYFIRIFSCKPPAHLSTNALFSLLSICYHFQILTLTNGSVMRHRIKSSHSHSLPTNTF